MCGLFGFASLSRNKLKPEEIEAGRRALTTLYHRGPDQHGEFVQGGVFMGHRRLSILDLSEEGRQPMKSHDESVAITVNGEIYNYKALRAEIGERNFRSHSDSEVVLHGFRKWGLARLIERIDGMYAIVIYDRIEGTLHFVRDRAGIKPLIYAQAGDYFIWASEMKAIVAFMREMGIEPQIDNTALYDFLTYRTIPGEKTLYREIRNLLPAHRLSVDLKSAAIQVDSYWILGTQERQDSHDMLAEELRGLLRQSVEEQMVSDVPVGFFLSGGIDSSLLVAQGAKVRPDLATFSIGYDAKAHDETHYAQIVAERFSTRHQTKILSAEDSIDFIPMLLEWYDQPFGDNSALPSYHVCAFTRQHATVALSGDGGDELFGGYRWYERFEKFRRVQKPLAAVSKGGPRLSLARKASGLAARLAQRLDLYSHTDPLELYCMLIDGLPPSLTARQRAELEIPDDYDALWHYRRYYREDLSPRKRMQFLDFHTFLPDDILTKMDRVSMAVALEARVPYLSRALIEFAFSCPESFIYKDGKLKGGLKYAFRNELPAIILDRPKKGFSIPMHVWGGDSERIRRFQEHVYDYVRAGQKLGA